MSGSATEQNGANSLVAFRYQMEVQLIPYSITPWMIDVYTNYLIGITNTTGETNDAVALNQWHYWQNNLHELKLTFSWPILGNNTPGPNRQYFRTTVSGRLRKAPDVRQIDPNRLFCLFFLSANVHKRDGHEQLCEAIPIIRIENANTHQRANWFDATGNVGGNNVAGGHRAWLDGDVSAGAEGFSRRVYAK